MDKFQYFLLEMTNEMDFIRTFFNNFRNFSSFDAHTLLVFADWLQEHDNPREELVRICSQVNNLEPDTAGGKRGRCAQRLGIPSEIIGSTDYVAGDEYTYFHFRGDMPGYSHFADDRAGYSQNPQYLMGMSTSQGWYMGKNHGQHVEMVKVNLNQIPDAPLSMFFWDLLGYGWGYGVNEEEPEIEISAADF